MEPWGVSLNALQLILKYKTILQVSKQNTKHLFCVFRKLLGTKVICYPGLLFSIECDSIENLAKWLFPTVVFSCDFSFNQPTLQK